MATENPRVTAYVQATSYELLKKFIDERGLSLSQGVDRIIVEYLGGVRPPESRTSILLRNTPVRAEAVEGLETFVAAIVEARSQFILDSTQAIVADFQARLESLEATQVGSAARDVLEALRHQIDVTLSPKPVDYQQSNSFGVPLKITNDTPKINSDSNDLDLDLDHDNSVSDGLKLASGTLFTQASLAKRLGVSPSLISQQKDKEGFSEWSQSRDPDGVAWRYDSQSKQFYPLACSP